MRDVMISICRDYGWPQLRVYANSIARCGMTAEKVFIWDNITPEAQDKLAALGFTLVQKSMPDTFPRFNYRSRQQAAAEWLQDHYQDYRFVLWSGIRDHIFQADPFVWLERYLGADTDRIVGAGEGWYIKNEPSNMRWIQKTVPESEWGWLQEREALCSDTIAGSAKLVHCVLENIARMVYDVEGGVDQAAANYVMYGPYGPKLVVPGLADGFTATWYPEKDMDPARLIGYDTRDNWQSWYLRHGTPFFDVRDGIVYTPDRKTPFSMVHQYDRCPVWKQIAELKYA